MRKFENLELVEVEYEGDKATLIFHVEDLGEIRNVTFNKQVYNPDIKKFVDSEEKADKVEEWCKSIFGESFSTLTNAVGTRHDIFEYDGFCSLFEINQPDKFTTEDVGLVDTAVIKEVTSDNVGIKINIEYDGKTYQSKMTYSKYMEAMKTFLVDPIKKSKQFAKFEEKFGCTVDDCDSLIDKNVMFEVKLALGKYVYVELKPIKKK